VIALDGTELLDRLALGWEYNFANPRHPTLLQPSGAFSGFVACAVLVPACSSPPTATPTSPGSSG
jgi:hypothetical protein